jgi:hypothetical protein
MKNTEAMEQSPTSTDLVLANGEAGGQDIGSFADAKRRRLVRGAMAVAPLVLTLRSGGALAAASCTGAAKYLGVTLGGSGIIPDGVNVTPTDVCYTTVTACETNGAKLSTDPKSYTKLGVVQLDSSGKYSCTGGKNNQTVAILSSQSAASLV